MTKETKDKVAKYVTYLKQAYNGYYRMSTSDLINLFTAVYGDDWKNKVSKTALTCGSCKIRELRKIYNDYNAKDTE